MTKLSFSALSAFSALSVGTLALAAGCADKKSPNGKPNIIVILADDLGYGDVSCYGSTTIRTPNFDRIAANGLRFTQGYSTAATSTPSRFSLLTGMYPWKNTRAKILPGDAPLIVDTAALTLPKLMKQAGYVTAAVGKWHLGLGSGNADWNAVIRPNPADVGYEYSYIMAATNDRVPCVYVENGRVDGLDLSDPISVNYKENFEGEPTGKLNPELLKMHPSHGHDMSIVNGVSRIGFMKGGKAALWTDETMADVFLSHAKQFICDNKDKPFFLYFGLHQPHVPRVPNERFAGKSGMGPRGDAILEADWEVGQLLDYLDELGLAENTLIIFSSDNGPVVDDGYKDQAVELLGDHKPAGPLRGGKYSLFDGGTRVPFIVRWPAEVKAGVSEAVVCQMDLTASCAALVGLPPTQNLDSQNVLEALLGKSPKGRNELIIEGSSNLAYREGNWVLIPPSPGQAYSPLTGTDTGRSPDYQLYNLEADLGQQTNLAASEPARVEAMKAALERLSVGNTR
ncbi:MAG: arylsulfatase [Tannerellaceae bacterium]|jgi:arylsulfatase A-like enzyme|nr:arylsulfatase [Tannerellaceae bacterium]